MNLSINVMAPLAVWSSSDVHLWFTRLHYNTQVGKINSMNFQQWRFIKISCNNITTNPSSP